MNNHFIINQPRLINYFNYDYQLHQNNLCAGLLVSIGLYVDHFGIRKSINDYRLNKHEMHREIKNYTICISSIRSQGKNAINIPEIKALSSLIESTLQRANAKNSISLQKILASVSNIFGDVFIMLSENSYQTYGKIFNNSITIYLYRCPQGLFTIFPKDLAQFNSNFFGFYNFVPKKILACGDPVSTLDINSHKCKLCTKAVYQLEKSTNGQVTSPKRNKSCTDCLKNSALKCNHCSKTYCINHMPSRKCDQCGNKLNKSVKKDSDQSLPIPDITSNGPLDDKFSNIFQPYQKTLAKSSSIKKILAKFLSYPSIKELILKNTNPTKHKNITKSLQVLISNDVKAELDQITNMISQLINPDSNNFKFIQLSSLLSARVIILGPIKIKLGPKTDISSLWQIILSKKKIIIQVKNPKSKRNKTVFTPRQQKNNDKASQELGEFKEKLKQKDLNIITLNCGCKFKFMEFLKKGCSEIGDFKCPDHKKKINKLEVALVEKFYFYNTSRCWKCGLIDDVKVKCSKCKFCFCELECSQNDKFNIKVTDDQIKCPKCMNKLVIDGSRMSIGIPKVGSYPKNIKNKVLELLEKDSSRSNCSKCLIFPQSKNNLCRICLRNK